MFVGNSITRHGVLPEIGWYGDYGMAASSIEKDYVHIVMNYIKRDNPDATFCICQCSEWERQYQQGDYVLDEFCDARDFGADIIIVRFVKNCPFVELGDLSDDDETKAIGLFAHSGVANHLGDKGMQAMADRIWEKL